MNTHKNTRDTDNATVQICDLSGIYHTVEKAELIETARSCISAQFIRGEAMTSPSMSAEYIQVLLAAYEHEVFFKYRTY